MSARLPHLRRDEKGFTLVELLAAMTIGLVLLMAAAMLLDRATALSGEIADRQDAAQRGRIAMEAISQRLHSQVCLGEGAEPITYGSDTMVTYYVDLSGETRNVERRTLRYDTTAGRKDIVEDIYASTGTYPDLTFAPTPRTRTLLRKADPIQEGTRTVLFRYYGFRAGGAPGELERLATPLTAANAARTVLVRVKFVALPDRGRPKDTDATTFESDVWSRVADPAQPSEGAQCF